MAAHEQVGEAVLSGQRRLRMHPERPELLGRYALGVGASGGRRTDLPSIARFGVGKPLGMKDVHSVERCPIAESSDWTRRKPGAVPSVQRFGGSLNAHPHLEAIAVDGAYTRDRAT